MKLIGMKRILRIGEIMRFKRVKTRPAATSVCQLPMITKVGTNCVVNQSATTENANERIRRLMFVDGTRFPVLRSNNQPISFERSK